MFRRVAGRPVLPRLDRAAQRRAGDVALPAHARVRHDQQPQPPAMGVRHHAEQGREQGPVRPVEPRAAARLPPLQDGELMAQDQDLSSLPRLLAPG
jgi:hypothetical protein